MESNHNTRPRECSTKVLETMQEYGSLPANLQTSFSYEDFMRELSRRKTSSRDLKAVRMQRREKAVERQRQIAADHATDSGDSRKKKIK